MALLLLAPMAGAAEGWGPAEFLIGKWTGVGSGALGNGAGTFSFESGLQGKVLVRKSFAEYPPAGGKPASRHDDLMVIYRDEGDSRLKATYFDSEGHVIQYAVKAAGEGVVFESGGPGPRYRLSYVPEKPGRLRLKFEIAPPGKEFATYIEAEAEKR